MDGGFCGFAYVFVLAVEVDELGVFECILYAFVSEHLHYVEDVFGFVVFHGCFPVSKSVEGDFVESWVSEFMGYAFSLFLVASSD